MSQRLNFLDKGSCTSVTGGYSRVESTAFHDAEWLRAKTELGDYPYVPIEQCSVYPQLLERMPGNSLLLDIGAGPRRHFSDEVLQRKKIDVVSITYAEPEMDYDHSVWLRADLRRLPPSLYGEKSLREGLEAFLKSLPPHPQHAIHSLRSETEILVQLLQEKPVGACMFGHILRYVPNRTQERLLALTTKSLMPGGISIFVDRAKALQAVGAQADYLSKPTDFKRTMKQGGLEVMTDELLVFQGTSQWFADIRAQCSDEAAFERAIMERIRSGDLPIVPVDPELDHVSLRNRVVGSDNIQALMAGVRHVVCQKPPL